MAFGVALLSAPWLGCDDVELPPDAAVRSGGGSSQVMDAGAMTDGEVGPMPPAATDASFSFGDFSPPEPICVLSVGAECDGDEDCPGDDVCCGTFDFVRVRYTSVSCRRSCDAPIGYKLCHPGDECPNPLHECRVSQIALFNFIMVCYDPLIEPPASQATRSRDIEGEVVCGQTTCQVGVEKCCLRSRFWFSQNRNEPLEPYCAPLDAACDCDDEPPGVAGPTDAGAGDDSDAGG